MQVMPVAGGWEKVVNQILEIYVPKVRSNPNTHVVGIIDCDNHPDRIAVQLSQVPDDVRERVFLLGTLDDPQAFKRSVKLTFERIGIQLVDECFHKSLKLWRHAQLTHISDEIDRAAATLHPILFSQ